MTVYISYDRKRLQRKYSSLFVQRLSIAKPLVPYVLPISSIMNKKTYHIVLFLGESLSSFF